MGFLDNSSITVDAILTKIGRKRISDGSFRVSKFSLSDEEIDYTLYDVTHPNGTDSYGTVIENMNLLEAQANRTGFNSHLINQTIAGAKIKLASLNYPNLENGDNVEYSCTGTVISGLSTSNVYKITVIDSDKFKLSASGTISAITSTNYDRKIYVNLINSFRYQF